MGKQYTKCDFCSFHTASGCSARPDSHYCKEALDEFYAWLREQKGNKNKGRR